MGNAIECVYSVHGKVETPALVLVHGIGSRRSGWDRLLPTLVDRFRVITYDLRGHGASPMPVGRFGLDAQVIGNNAEMVDQYWQQSIPATTTRTNTMNQDQHWIFDLSVHGIGTLYRVAH